MRVNPLLTVGTVAEVAVHVTGDIGGSGISRYRFTRNDAGITTVADCNAAGAAIRALYNAVTDWPTGVTWAVSPNVELFDVGSALVQGSLTMTTPPANVIGSGGTSWAAGIGARINWKTGTISGRRLLRGATFMIPLAPSAFGASGAIAGSKVTILQNAATAYIAAMNTANLQPVVWHRPLKGVTSGGTMGPVTASLVTSTPSGLRSRRS